MGTAALGGGLVRDLERRVRQAQNEWHSPAVSAGLVRNGALVWSSHVGSARLEPVVAPTDDTQYMIGSITKTFTATVLSEIGLSVARPTEPLRRSGSCTDPRHRPTRAPPASGSGDAPLDRRQQKSRSSGAAAPVAARNVGKNHGPTTPS